MLSPPSDPLATAIATAIAIALAIATAIAIALAIATATPPPTPTLECPARFTPQQEAKSFPTQTTRKPSLPRSET
jgi:hypothetical protein